jgi:hypothetical protein
MRSVCSRIADFDARIDPQLGQPILKSVNCADSALKVESTSHRYEEVLFVFWCCLEMAEQVKIFVQLTSSTWHPGYTA